MKGCGKQNGFRKVRGCSQEDGCRAVSEGVWSGTRLQRTEGCGQEEVFQRLDGVRVHHMKDGFREMRGVGRRMATKR